MKVNIFCPHKWDIWDTFLDTKLMSGKNMFCWASRFKFVLFRYLLRSRIFGTSVVEFVDVVDDITFCSVEDEEYVNDWRKKRDPFPGWEERESMGMMMMKKRKWKQEEERRRSEVEKINNRGSITVYCWSEECCSRWEGKKKKQRTGDWLSDGSRNFRA